MIPLSCHEKLVSNNPVTWHHIPEEPLLSHADVKTFQNLSTLTEVFSTLTEVFPTLTEVLSTLTEVFPTLTEVFLP